MKFDYKGLNVLANGSHATNGFHREVDLGVNYTWKWFTLGVSDYYFPVRARKDHCFNYRPKQTAHDIETLFNFSASVIPLWWFQMSTYVMALDRTANGKQAFSTSLELGCRHSSNEKDHLLSLALCVSSNRNMYNHYEKNFCFANVVLSFESGIAFRNFFLPISVSLVFNPYTQKPTFVLSVILDTHNQK